MEWCGAWLSRILPRAKPVLLRATIWLLEAGDEVIGCNSDGIRWQATIDEVVEATSQDEEGEVGDPVRILKGSLLPEADDQSLLRASV